MQPARPLHRRPCSDATPTHTTKPPTHLMTAASSSLRPASRSLRTAKSASWSRARSALVRTRTRGALSITPCSRKLPPKSLPYLHRGTGRQGEAGWGPLNTCRTQERPLADEAAKGTAQF